MHNFSIIRPFDLSSLILTMFSYPWTHDILSIAYPIMVLIIPNHSVIAFILSLILNVISHHYHIHLIFIILIVLSYYYPIRLTLWSWSQQRRTWFLMASSLVYSFCNKFFHEKKLLSYILSRLLTSITYPKYASYGYFPIS